MSDIIHLLPDSVANQIAAGEVIQRPASVIKELVENAVDAGAKNIQIFIKNAGRTLIQVVDDGKGMTETDARMAFERHATSKISSAEDMSTLITMGFRGEALPSICAIAQVEMHTRTDNDRLGTNLKINCSKVESQEPCVCDRGTNIMVRNIFCNFPARRKFLKSDTVELANIMREFERLALVNNHLHMSIDTGNKVIDLRPGSFKQRIGDIWKNNLNLQLLPVEVETSVVKISGFVSRPEFARRRNPLQYLITNGRNMRKPYFHKAIISCFAPLIAADTQPCYFLKFEVDPSTIDVNIHPTKNEIKFENESEIWHILTMAVRASLGKFAAVPSIDFESDALPASTSTRGGVIQAPEISTDPSYNPFDKPVKEDFAPVGTTRNAGSYNPQHKKASSSWSRLYADFMAGVKDSDDKRTAIADDKNMFVDDDIVSTSPRECIQYAEKYIITPSAEGLMIIDQHRAHLKLLYDEFVDIAKNAGGVSQKIMFPEELHLDESQQSVFKGIRPELAKMGYQFAPTEGEGWSIVGVPSMLVNTDAKDLILRIIDSLTDDSENYGKDGLPVESVLQRVALVMARSAAITGGKSLSKNEMESMVTRLLSKEDPMFTPNGNPIIKIIDDSTLRNMFG